MPTLSQIRRIVVIAGLSLFCAASHAQNWTLSLSWKLGSCTGSNGAEVCNVGPNAAAQNDAAPASARLTALSLRAAKVDCATGTLAADALPEDIAATMPATAADSYQQQWNRYGSCTGYTPAGYFAQLAAMTRAVARTHLGQFLDEHAGKRVRLDELKDAQLHDFFLGADKAVQFYCTPEGRLAEVRYVLRDWSEMFVHRDKGGMLAPASAPGGNCGDEVRL